MQTFVPEGLNFELGFENLDYKRLGKQRVEAWQILNSIRRIDNSGNPLISRGWISHPATRMWSNYPRALALYGIMCCEEWINRGYKDSLFDRFVDVYESMKHENPEPPAFLDDLMESHRSNLIRKYPEYYQPIWPNTPNDIPYLWPV
jgi:hypothetical protein